MSIKEINKLISLQNKKIIDNISIITPDDIGMNYVLRIDRDLMTRKSFIPRIAVKQAETEDRTLPRIVVSPYLLGCMIAYPNINPVFSRDLNQLHTGFYIHSIEFEYCLKPTKKLVYDSDETNELWLVTYNKDTIEYKAKKAGEIIISNFTITPNDSKDLTKCLIEYYINVIKDDGLYFNKKHKLDKGYQSIKFYLNPTKRNYSEMTLDDKDGLEIKSITKDEFEKVKRKQTALEHFYLINKQTSKLQNW